MTSEGEAPISRSEYVANFKLLLRLLPAALDHASDIPVLITLWKRNHRSLFFVGLGIDLLPGPIAVYQFLELGFGWRKSLALILHPINAFVHTVRLILSGNGNGNEEEKNFSCAVVTYAHDCQGLLESPLQVCGIVMKPEYTVISFIQSNVNPPLDPPI